MKVEQMKVEQIKTAEPFKSLFAIESSDSRPGPRGHAETWF
jgi:hypothetical protein